MTKQEFLDTLRRSLNREMDEREVNDNIRYYDDYIRQEMAGGKTEAQVIAELGDPRLIAKTILQVDEQKDNARERGYAAQETIYTEGDDGGYTQENPYERQDGGFHMRSFQVSGWKIALVVIAVLLVIFFIMGAAVAIIWKLLPVILVVSLAAWVYNRFIR